MTTELSEQAAKLLQRSSVRERFIPISRHELVLDLTETYSDERKEQLLYAAFCELLGAVYHYRFHKSMERLKANYGPFAPDTDTPSRKKFSDEQRLEKRLQMRSDISELLNDANYDRLSVEDINKILGEASPAGVEVTVDMDAFDELQLFYRNSYSQIRYSRSWKQLWMKKIPYEVETFSRLFILFKAKPVEQRIPEKKGLLGRWLNRRRRETADFDSRCVYMKLFKDIPVSDLRMMFPNCKVRMRPFDKIKIGVTGGGSTIGSALAAAGKVGAAAANPITIVIAIFGFFGVVARQIMTVINKRNEYMMTLAKHLYFHNQANNLGVITRLVDMAEEEECKETMLAYHFLSRLPEYSVDQEELDERIERYIHEQYGYLIDFEVDDALRKLEADGMLRRNEAGMLKVIPLLDVCKQLDEYWDELYNFDGSDEDIANPPEALDTAQIMPQPGGGLFSRTRKMFRRAR